MTTNHSYNGTPERLPLTLESFEKFFELKGALNSIFLRITLNLDIPFAGNKRLEKGLYFLHQETFVLYTMREDNNENATPANFLLNPLRLDDAAIMLHHIIQWILAHHAEEFESSFIQHWTEFLNKARTHQNTVKPPMNQMQEEQNIAEALKSVIPQNHIKPNNKLAREITRDFLNSGEILLRVNSINAKKEITTRAVLSYNEDKVNLTGRAKFTPYDREVNDGIITLWEAGNFFFTPAMVFRAMNGMTETEYVSPQAIGAVTKSLEKSRRIMVSIDFSQEAAAYKKNCKAIYEGYLLACDKVTVSTGGQKQDAYRLLRKPILYEYAQVSGQILNIPIALLQTKEAVRNTDEVIVIRGYLLRQIEGIKSKHFSRSNKITFKGVFEELDITPESFTEAMYKKKIHTVRQHVLSLLDEWKRQKYIKGYEQYKDGKTIKGVMITL